MEKLRYYHLLNQNKIQLLFYRDKNVEHWSYYKVMHLLSSFFIHIMYVFL